MTFQIIFASGAPSGNHFLPLRAYSAENAPNGPVFQPLGAAGGKNRQVEIGEGRQMAEWDVNYFRTFTIII